PGAPTPATGIPALGLPAHPELAATVTSLLAHENALLGRLHDRIGAAYGLYLDLCDTARTLVQSRAEAMIAASQERDVGKRRKLLANATNDFLVEADRALQQITAEGVAAQSTLLASDIADLLKRDAAMPSGTPRVVHIERPRTMFRPAPDDTHALRSYKRRQRWRYVYRRSIPQAIAIRELVQRRHQQIVGEDVTHVLSRFRTSTHHLAIEIGRALGTAEWKLHAQLSRLVVDDPDGLVAAVALSRDDTCLRLDALAGQVREKIAEDAATLDGAALAAARALSAILDRIDAPDAAREAARAAVRHDDFDELANSSDAWREQQLHLLERARLGVRLARFRDRLTIATARAVGELVGSMHASGQRALQNLRAALIERRDRDREQAEPLPDLPDEIPYDGSPPIVRLTQVAAMLSGELPESETVLTDDAAAVLARGETNTETTTVPVRAAVQSIVEIELLTKLAADVVQLAEGDARAWAVARETMILVVAQPRASDEEEPAGSQAAFDPIARIDGQLGKLREVERTFVEGVLSGLQSVASAMAPDGVAASLIERGGRRAAVKSPSRVLGLARRGVSGIRDAAANIIYRRSAGVVFAEQARGTRQRTPEQVIRELTARATVPTSVLANLPLYYRNLFTGQVNINESFFVGRDDKVTTGVEIVTGERPGLRSVLVRGQRSAGKTTLCQRIASSSAANVLWIAPPIGGACTRAAVASALEVATGRQGNPAALLDRLPERSVLVFDDLDLWWERRPGGLEAIDAILELVADRGDRVGFVLAGSEAPLRVLQNLRPLSRFVYAQLDCQPLVARALEKVIMTRHGSTGIALKLAGRKSFGTWTRARLFDAHFAYAKGNVGYALRSWVTHLDSFTQDHVTIRMPRLLDWDAIDDLKPEHVALLIELVLHKAATASKLQRLTERSAEAVADGLAELTSIGLVIQNRRRIAQLNPFVHVPVLDWLHRRELA
ncbi:MAG: hypothetical protein AB7L28_09710, partial [Kofleriaceae bacterium]